jgi:hypothetical protein
MAMDTGQLLLIGGVALGGYYLYTNYLNVPAVAAATTGTPAAGSAASSDGTGTPAAATVLTTPAAAAMSSIISGSWTDVYNRLLAAVIPDANLTGSGPSSTMTPYQWEFYLERVMIPGQVASSLPDMSTVFPGVDLTQQMTAATFWAGMGAALGAPVSSLPAPIATQDQVVQAVTAGVSAADVLRPGTVGERSATSGSRSLVGYGLGDGGTDINGNICTPGWDAGCIPNPLQTFGVTPLPTDYSAITQFLTPSTPTAAGTGLAAVPWWVWALGGGLVLVMMVPSGGRR